MDSPTLPRLRAYQASDAPFVETLARLAFSEYSPRAGAPSVHAATLPGVVAIVAVAGSERAGFAMLTVRKSRERQSDAMFASLDAIAVEPAHRGRGVGRALVRGAELEARKRRVVDLQLVTAEANVAALDLFLRAGF